MYSPPTTLTVATTPILDPTKTCLTNRWNNFELSFQGIISTENIDDALGSTHHGSAFISLATRRSPFFSAIHIIPNLPAASLLCRHYACCSSRCLSARLVTFLLPILRLCFVQRRRRCQRRSSITCLLEYRRPPCGP